jgi:hypothetical protein
MGIRADTFPQGDDVPMVRTRTESATADNAIIAQINRQATIIERAPLQNRAK